jgi:DNA polymerase I-like protein with 3'-5' exonuclease and polymerase domains
VASRLSEDEKLERARIKADKAAAKLAEREAAAAVRKAEMELRKQERDAERERLKAEKAEAKAREKLELAIAKLEEAEGPKYQLPAIVNRKGVVVSTDTATAWRVLQDYMSALCLDVETSGYPPGHEHYALRTVQLGGEHYAVVLDADDEEQMVLASLALKMADKLHAHSAVADLVPCVIAGLIGWDEAWAKMHDSVLYAKLTDPKQSGSDAEGLKELASALLSHYATAPLAEKAKNALFKVMGCLVSTEITTPVERNGWYMVNKNCETMIVYAGSDVLDLGAVLRMLPSLPVDNSVLDREREFEAICSRVAWTGFKLDTSHVKEMIAKYEKEREELLAIVQYLSSGLIENPSSPDTGEKLLQLFPELDGKLELSEKTGKPSAAKASLERPAKEGNVLCKAILAYRHSVTTLGLLLRPLENLCDYGDGRMRPTVYTINADTGRTSCVRPNGQQFSRQGGIRQCVRADEGFLGIAADFQGCEIRVAAALSGDKEVLEAEISPKCYLCDGNPCTCGKHHTGLHWLAAHIAWGEGATKENRYVAKRIIFSKLFGGSPAAGARQTGVTMEESQAVHDAFSEIAPVYTEWDKWLRKCFYEGKMVWRDYETGQNYGSDLPGSRRGIYRTYSGRNIYINSGHAFGNYAIQGTARELLVDGVLRWNQTRWAQYPILPVHDEVLSWVPADEAHEAVQVLKQCMETSVLSTPDFPVTVGADPDEPFAYWPDSS